MTDFLPLLKVGAKHSVLNLSPTLLQTLICLDCFPISTLDSSEKITWFQSETVFFLYFSHQLTRADACLSDIKGFFAATWEVIPTSCNAFKAVV